MTIEKKLAVFERITQEEAIAKRKNALDEIEASFNAAIETAVLAAEQQAREKIRSEQNQIEMAGNKQVAAASSEAKHAEAALRTKLMAQLFDDALADLRVFTQTPEYGDFLLDSLRLETQNAPNRYDRVLIMKRDGIHASRLQSETGLGVNETDEDFLGGFKLITADGRGMRDKTLQNRLAMQRKQFTL
jgi:vacuolar-type H+-ATPase subunit E/Vma4